MQDRQIIDEVVLFWHTYKFSCLINVNFIYFFPHLILVFFSINTKIVWLLAEVLSSRQI